MPLLLIASYDRVLLLTSNSGQLNSILVLSWSLPRPVF